jgi:hypothetical protein
MGERRRAHRVLFEQSKEKKPSGRPKSRRVDNIKMDLQIVGWGGMDRVRTGTGGGRF